MAGQPEFDRKLDAPNLRNLKQRIVLRYNLSPFNEQDTANYINSRFTTAGMPHQRVLLADLIVEIHRRAQGIPRLINAICDNLLLTAFADASKPRLPTCSMKSQMTCVSSGEIVGDRAPALGSPKGPTKALQCSVPNRNTPLG